MSRRQKSVQNYPRNYQGLNLQVSKYLLNYFVDDIPAQREDKMDSVTQQPTVAPKDRKEILRKALQTECDLETVTVAVDKVTMEVSVPMPTRVIQLLSISVIVFVI